MEVDLAVNFEKSDPALLRLTVRQIIVKSKHLYRCQIYDGKTVYLDTM